MSNEIKKLLDDAGIVVQQFYPIRDGGWQVEALGIADDVHAKLVNAGFMWVGTFQDSMKGEAVTLARFDVVEVFNYMGIEQSYGADDDWFEVMLLSQQTADGSDEPDYDTVDPNTLSQYEFSLYLSHQREKLTPPAPAGETAAVAAFAVGDRVYVTGWKAWGVIDFIADDVERVSVIRDGDGRQILVDREYLLTEEQAYATDTITIPLDAFDALLHERREVEFYAELASETLGEYMVAVGDLREQIAALEAERDEFAMTAINLRNVLLKARSRLQGYIDRQTRPMLGDIILLEIDRVVAESRTGKPSPDDDDPTPTPARDTPLDTPAIGGGALDESALDDVDSVDDDVMGAVMLGTGAKANSPTNFHGTFEDARVVPYIPLPVQGHDADPTGRGDVLVCVYRDGAMAWAWADDSAKAVLIDKGYATADGALTDMGKERAAAMDAPFTAMHDIFAAEAESERIEGNSNERRTLHRAS